MENYIKSSINTPSWGPSSSRAWVEFFFLLARFKNICLDTINFVLLDSSSSTRAVLLELKYPSCLIRTRILEYDSSSIIPICKTRKMSNPSSDICLLEVPEVEHFGILQHYLRNRIVKLPVSILSKTNSISKFPGSFTIWFHLLTRI